MNPAPQLQAAPRCGWGECPRPPRLRVEYRLLEPGGALPSGLPWIPAKPGGAVALCAEHAARLGAVLPAGQLLSFTPLP